MFGDFTSLFAPKIITSRHLPPGTAYLIDERAMRDMFKMDLKVDIEDRKTYHEMRVMGAVFGAVRLENAVSRIVALADEPVKPKYGQPVNGAQHDFGFVIAYILAAGILWGILSL